MAIEYASSPDAHPTTQAANLASGVLALKQLRNHLASERLECLGVAKELGHADQQILEKPIHLFRLALQRLNILLDGVNL